MKNSGMIEFGEMIVNELMIFAKKYVTWLHSARKLCFHIQLSSSAAPQLTVSLLERYATMITKLCKNSAVRLSILLGRLAAETDEAKLWFYYVLLLIFWCFFNLGRSWSDIYKTDSTRCHVFAFLNFFEVQQLL